MPMVAYQMAPTAECICRMGIHSRRAAAAALGTGLLPEDVETANLEEGFNSWVSAGYPLVMTHAAGAQTVNAVTFKVCMQ